MELIKFSGITADQLINVLKKLPGDTKVCIELSGYNYPSKQVRECIYYEWDNGKKIAEHKGILIG